ncbi:MAG: alpha/beta hydrolase, partial [Pseudomonadota bacterium]
MRSANDDRPERIAPLVQRGVRVIAFDHPAHGQSRQLRASLIDLARATLSVARAHGPFDAALAHSIGCLATLLAHAGGPPLAGHHRFGRLCFIAAPNAMSLVTDRFAHELKLSNEAQSAFERHVSRVGHRPLTTFSAANLLAALPVPTRLIHAMNDDRIPFTESVAIAD